MPSWYPGQVAVGYKVFGDPVIFQQAVSVQGAATVTGAATFQKGIATGPSPAITTPSTVPSPGTVTNTTGFDVMVYAAATTGIGAIKFPSQGGSVVPGSTVSPSNQVTDVYLPSGASIAVTYTGTLTWLWLSV